MPGDVGIVPKSMGHYVENLSTTKEVEMLEIFKAPKFEVFSLERWPTATPSRNVAEHLFKTNAKTGERFTQELRLLRNL